MDYYPTISSKETKQTNKQNDLLTLTVSCEKSCLIRRKKINEWIIIIIIIIIIKMK